MSCPRGERCSSYPSLRLSYLGGGTLEAFSYNPLIFQEKTEAQRLSDSPEIMQGVNGSSGIFNGCCLNLGQFFFNLL